MFGLSEKGFKRKTYNDILDSMEMKAKELYGENINLSERSPLGLIIKIVAWALSTLWQLIEKVYYSAFIDDSEGIQLDKVAKNIGLYRKPPLFATGTIKVIGEEGTFISKDLIIGTKDGINFKPTENIVIDSSGTASVPIIAENYGTQGNVPIGVITEIVTPIAGLESIVNESATKGGRNSETDHEFRDRYYNSTSKAGASTVDSITASILDVEGVRTALVIENTSMLVDEKGRPPKSIQAYVLGGDRISIAKAIFSSKAGGIEAYGTESEVVTDISGKEHVIKFSFAQVKNIFVQIDLKRNNKYPSVGDKLIKTEIIKYIGGLDSDGQLYNGLNIGKDVVFTQVVSIIHKVPGIEDFDLKLGIDLDTLQSANISIADIEVAETSPDKVVINYV